MWRAGASPQIRASSPRAIDPVRAPPSAAVGKDDVDVVRAAARLGANLDRRDPTGMTPLHYAAQLGRVDVARALVDAGADADARTYSTNIVPIWLAAYHGRLDVVKGGPQYAHNQVDRLAPLVLQPLPILHAEVPCC